MDTTDTPNYENYDEITARLDEIVSAVRDKDTSLERSLDLFDEAIELGSKAVDMVDKVDFSEEEAAQLDEAASASGADDGAATESESESESTASTGDEDGAE